VPGSQPDSAELSSAMVWMATTAGRARSTRAAKEKVVAWPALESAGGSSSVVHRGSAPRSDSAPDITGTASSNNTQIRLFMG
jgi:hypothetical protein